MNYKKESINEFPEYQIDTNGIVYNKNGSPKKYSLNKKGYCIVNFMQNGKRYGRQVHVLVAKQFIPNPENKPTVNHINGDKEDNNINNLEWATNSEQMLHAINILKIPRHCTKITGYNKDTGKLEYEFDSLIEAGKYFTNLSESDINYQKARHIQNCISRVLNGNRHTYKNCIWQYS